MSQNIEIIKSQFSSALGNWYIEAKKLTNKSHVLGAEKEILKETVCAAIDNFCTQWEDYLKELGHE